MGRPRRNWTAEEDNMLRRAVNTALRNSRPLVWRELAKSVPGRSNKDCRKRWWNSLAEGTSKGPWTEEEDEQLLKAVQKHGTNWHQVARLVMGRNSDQCSSHWSQVLDPSINFCDWTAEEDDHLLHAILSHGTNWSTIAAEHQPKRTTLALKNRYSTLRLRHHNSKLRSQSAMTAEETAASRERRNTATSLERALFDPDNDEEGDEDDDDEYDGEEDANDVEAEDLKSGSAAGKVTTEHITNTLVRESLMTDLPATTAIKKTTSPSTICVEPADFTDSSNIFPVNAYPRDSGCPVPSAEQWADAAANHADCLSLCSLDAISTHIGQDLWGSVHDASVLPSEMSFVEHGNDVVDLDPSFFSNGLQHERKTSILDHYSIANSRSSMEATGSISNASPGDSSNPSPVSKAVSTNSGDLGSNLHKVSITMSCTTDQLKNVMGWVVEAGSGVSVEIDMC